jgi:hypothetical protein
MFKSKTAVIVALIAFAMGIIFVGDSVAEEEVKVSTVNHDVKLFPIRVPGEEIHMVASNEEKGISINKEARMEEGRAKFGLNYSLEYICSFTATLRREMIGPLASCALVAPTSRTCAGMGSDYLTSASPSRLMMEL